MKSRGRRPSIQALEDASKVRALSIDPLAPSSAFDETLRDRLREDAERKAAEEAIDEVEEEEGMDEGEDREEGTAERGRRLSERVLERRWRAPLGKKIAVPVRIEPKVYFATERTFLVSLTIPVSSCSVPLPDD